MNLAIKFQIVRTLPKRIIKRFVIFSNQYVIFSIYSYQINARTELAIRYNDISPLENHHCAVAFQILSNPETNIFSNVDKDTYKRVRAVIWLHMLNLFLIFEYYVFTELQCTCGRIINVTYNVWPNLGSKHFNKRQHFRIQSA